jgi:hypothetical protein
MRIRVEFTRELKPSVFGWAIVRFGGKPFSHARIRFMGEDGVEKLFHAIEDGVRVEDYVPSDEIVVASFPLTLNCSEDRFYGVVIGSEGKSYGWTQILLIALGIDFKWIRNNRGKFICSELVGWVLFNFYALKLPENQDQWKPWDIYAALADHFLVNNLRFERYPARKLVSLPRE